MDLTVAALIAAIAAPIGAYRVAARRFSGKIESSDAKELWAESRSIRDWSQSRIETLNETVDKLEKRVDKLEQSNDALAEENRKLTAQVSRLEFTISELQGEIRTLTELLRKSRARVTELEDDPDARS